jgi:hypothetical protein
MGNSPLPVANENSENSLRAAKLAGLMQAFAVFAGLNSKGFVYGN